MVTKTLTITEESYNLLKERKLENESFSQEIRRILTKKSTKSLKDFFGIISDEKGERMLEFLEKKREWEIKALKKKFA